MSEESKITQTEEINCPICDKPFRETVIEQHANKCIFFNCPEDQQKRKRTPSPDLKCSVQPKFKCSQKSPRDKQNGSTKLGSSSNNFAALFHRSNISKADSINTSSGNKTVEIIEVDEKEMLESSANSTKKAKTNYHDMSFKIPLAIQVQPKTLDDFFGQNHILGKDTMLRSLLEEGKIPNMILWGPPGCGKTSLARVIQEMCKKYPSKFKFVILCAATCGVKDVQNIVTLAKNDLKFGKRTVLFMDEIHRFNKKQQDVFLLSVEKGDITLIGATTENPSFFINSALLSRCRVIVMEKLESEDLNAILEKAAEYFEIDVIDVDNPAGTFADANAGAAIENTALKWLADISDGDARIALGNLQLTLQHCNKNKGKIITVKDVENEIKKSHMLYDRTGEEHYNIISAMHKSIRGSDANAAVYWTTRMIVSGEDPRYIARRMVRAASEDIGNADPQALPLAIATMQGCQLLGMPEADVLLAQCAIYLARAPKSREADTALARAKRLINECRGPQPAVPMHLRNAPTKLMKNLGYGQLQENEDFTFMPPQYKDVNFFH